MISLASYMFRPPIVAIFKEVFFEGYIDRQKSYVYKMLNFP